MSEIHVKEGESLDSALKRFKRSCAKAGIVAEVRKRECYESPSVKRRKKSEAARKNRNKRYYSLASKKTCHILWQVFFRSLFKGNGERSSVTRCITRRVKRGIAALHPAGEKTLTTAPVRGGYPRPPGT